MLNLGILESGGAPSPPARYWRLLFPNGSLSDDFLELMEVELRSTVGGARQDTSGGGAASSEFDATTTAAKAFDGNTSTGWSTTLNSTINSWLSNDLGSAKDIAQLSLRGHPTTSGWGPSDITVQFSADNAAWTDDTRWTNLASLPWVNGETKLVTRGGEMRRVAGIPALNTDSGAWVNFTVRTVFAATVAPTGGTRARISIQAGNAEGLTINKCYIQVKGAGAYEFSTTPVQVTFNGGSTSCAISAAATQISDDITITTSPGDALVVSMFVPSGSSAADTFRRVSMTGVTGGFKAGDDAATVTPSGYTASNFAYIASLHIFTP